MRPAVTATALITFAIVERSIRQVRKFVAVLTVASFGQRRKPAPVTDLRLVETCNYNSVDRSSAQRQSGGSAGRAIGVGMVPGLKIRRATTDCHCSGR